MTGTSQPALGSTSPLLGRLAFAAGLCAALVSGRARAQTGEPARVSIQETRVAGHALPRFDASLLIAAPMERVWSLVSDCRRAREFMDLESSELLARRGKTVRCRAVVDVPFPFGTLEGVTDATDESRIGVLRQSWRLVTGDYVYDEGFWELSTPRKGYTRVRYVTLTEPKLPVPSSMLASGQRDFVEKMLLRLRERLTLLR
jgi:hypothetical protein